MSYSGKRNLKIRNLGFLTTEMNQLTSTGLIYYECRSRRYANTPTIQLSRYHVIVLLYLCAQDQSGACCLKNNVEYNTVIVLGWLIIRE